MTRSTIYLARLSGIFALVMVTAMGARGSAAMLALVQDSSVMLVLAMLSVGAGLAIILAHNRWQGGALPVAVTVLGWWIFIKGVVLLLAPQSMLVDVVARIQGEGLFTLSLLPGLMAGILLTWLGFEPHIDGDRADPGFSWLDGTGHR